MDPAFPSKVYNAYRSMPSQASVSRAYNTKLIKKLQNKVNLNTGETLVYQLTGTVTLPTGAIAPVHLTGIGQGDGFSDRTGRRVTIRGFSVNTHLGVRGLDCYHILSKSGIAPTYGNFQPVEQGHLVNIARNDLRVVKYIKPLQQTTYARYNKKYKSNHHVWYSGTSGASTIKNAHYLIFKNDTGANVSFDYSINVYFTDQ